MGVKIDINNNQIDRLIYRTGSGNDTNFTPRPIDVKGLSYTLVRPEDQPYTFTTLSAVNSTKVLKAVIDGPKHVSVFPTNQATMQGWIDSRPNAAESPHPYTVIMKGISIRMKKGEVP